MSDQQPPGAGPVARTGTSVPGRHAAGPPDLLPDGGPAERGWRRLSPGRGQVLIALFGVVLVSAALLVVGYLLTPVPTASSVSTAEATVVYAADGRTVLGRIGEVNRVDVALSQVPLVTQRAVLAAEDRHYYSEPGISPTGILRALWADLTGGSIIQGGSTITQQYVKNAYLTQARSISRKIKEIFIAVKLDHERSKQQILQDYLNTIYFGRGAYGIEAAAHAYFGLDVSRLDVAQSAVLAAVIRGPSLYDPAIDPAAARARWVYVINGMVTEHWLSTAVADSLRYPTVLPPQPVLSSSGGPDGFIVAEVKEILAAHGFGEAMLAAGGYKVITTIDPTAQRAAVDAEDTVLASHQTPDGEPLSALVAVQPGTGAIKAMYGGRNYADPHIPLSFTNLVYQPRQPGSSFKLYTLLTALEKGVRLTSVLNGTSPLVVPGWDPTHGNLVTNDSGEQCPSCTVVEATARSVNTVYAQLAVKLGPKNIRSTAYAAGVSTLDPLSEPDGTVFAGITLGVYDVRPIDQAVGFATVAAQGVRARSYLVAEVISPTGQVVYQESPQRARVFSSKITADATYALTRVLQDPAGTAYGRALVDNRPAAGKTGTTTRNVDAWFVGFTPQLCAAVWMGNADNTPLTNVPGFSGGVYGGSLPAEIWQRFMDLALAGQPVLQFPKPTQPTTPPPSPTPSPSASRSPSPSPSTRPSRTPSPSPSPSHSPSPSPSPTRSPTPSVSPSPSPSRHSRPPPPPPPD